MIVREARPADFDAVARLTVAAYREDRQLEGETGYDELLADVASRAETGTLLAAADEAEFRMLAVDPTVQGAGVGEALVRACLQRAAEHGCTAVTICTRDFAAAAQRLYARLGFQRVPELDWSPMPGVDLLALRYTLTPPAELTPAELTPAAPEPPAARLPGAGRR